MDEERECFLILNNWVKYSIFYWKEIPGSVLNMFALSLEEAYNFETTGYTCNSMVDHLIENDGDNCGRLKKKHYI